MELGLRMECLGGNRAITDGHRSFAGKSSRENPTNEQLCRSKLRLPSFEGERDCGASNMFIVADKAGWTACPKGDRFDVFVANALASRDGILFLVGMGKKTNIPFMDGHVESLRAELTYGRTKEVMRRWNRTNKGIQRRYGGRFNPVFIDEGWIHGSEW